MGQALAIAAPIAGAGADVYAGYAQNEYYKDLANQAENQGVVTLKTAQQNKTQIYDTAAEQNAQVEGQLGQTLSTAKANLAAGNIGLSSKTAEDIARSGISAANKDEMAIKYNADLSAWNTMTEGRNVADNLNRQAAGYRKAGKNAITQGYLSGFSKLMGGASSVISSGAK